MTDRILKTPVTRRQAVKGLALSAGAAALTVPQLSVAQSDKPDELNIAGWSQPRGEMTALTQRYEEETGIKTNYLEMPSSWSDLVTKYTNYMRSGYEGIDVYLLDDFTVAQFNAAGWIIDMKSSLTQQEIDAWLPAVQEMFDATGGVHRLPVFFGAGAFYYRTDILEEASMAPPETWEELIDMSIQLKDMYPEMWPWAPMADTGNQDVNFTIQSLWQGGGDPLVLNDEGSIQALQYMHDIIHVHEITPGAITTYGGNETQALALEGRQIMWWDFETGLDIYNQEDSPIKGKVGVTKWPAGPGGSWGMAHSWGWGVSQFSKHQEAAIEFAKWATEPDQLKEFMIDMAGRTPPKTELAEDPAVQEQLPFVQFLSEVADNLRFRVIDIPNPLEVHNVIGQTGSSVLTGQQSVEETASDGNERMQDVLAPRD